MTRDAAPPTEYPDIVGSRPEHPEVSTFHSYIPDRVVLPELTARALILGTLLGIVFGASSLYLVLKVGLTVSASIPVAVIAVTLFTILSKVGVKNSTILENNIVQTAGSAGESIAFGIGVTMPAIMILGFDLELTRVLLVSVLGGLLGILMMIPLRRALIDQQHGILKYPEGTACAEVLKAGASDESLAAASKTARAEWSKVEGEEEGETASAARTGGRIIFAGFGIALIYKTAMSAFKSWKEIPEKIFGAPFQSASVSVEVSPELLGVGYIIGPRIASIMCAGGVLAYLVLIPAIKFFGQGVAGAVAPGTIPIGEMTPDDIRNAYVLYIGAGAVAAGGIISLGRSLPTIWRGMSEGLGDFRITRRGTRVALPRTQRDLPMRVVLFGSLALIILIVLSPSLHMNLLGAVLIVIFGFLFVTVSSRLTGEIGSSSNPISGMTVATLLLTCLIFLMLGWTGPGYFVTALSVGAIVCIAASNGGTTSQDLKTGFLVGGTPKLQQIAILVGSLTSALILGPILLSLNDASTVYVPRVTFEPVPQSAPLDAGLIQSLPTFEEDSKPSNQQSYRVLSIGHQGLPEAPDLKAGEYLVNDAGVVVYKVSRNFPPDLRTDPSRLTAREGLQGSQAELDSNQYLVWHKTDTVGGPPGRYLVDDQGTPVYLVDPGINGVHRFRPNGTEVTKYSAPKATLMSYIIKGVLDRQLPWGLVLLGVMIAVILEMSGIPSLAFAVGVYLPLSSSSPILVGGMIRWLVDSNLRWRFRHRNLTEEQLVAEGDRSPGVLAASGYIAGGAMAGIIIAFVADRMAQTSRLITDWSTAYNPFYEGSRTFLKGYADVLALVPFFLLTALLYIVGRGWLFSHRSKRP